ncbi:MAG: glycosyl hydrolase [Opitutales bacterium]|jgi:mannan endo-1,4-beta-mannosidase
MKCLLILPLFSMITASAISAGAAQPKLIDAQATPQTVALFHMLNAVGQEHVLFGHHDTLAYGHDWIGDPNRSDVKDVTGDFPAVYGWDLNPLEPAGMNPPPGRTTLTEADLLAYARQAYSRGGVLTYCWHQANPVTKGSFYDLTPGLHTLLPGGEHHDYYLMMLDRIAAFFKQLSPMPVIFRPYHEHNGEWFWWGKTHCTEADFIAMWRFTITYLRDVKGVHNVIYAFSPDRGRIDYANGDADYFYGYPGDEYVDIMGLDDYVDVGKVHEGLTQEGKPQPTREEKNANFVRGLEMVVKIAEDRGKVPALTEAGCEALSVPDWWTEVLLKGLNANAQTRKVVYVEVWRNANVKLEGMKNHFFAPFPGQATAEDFIKFRDSDLIMFESELPDMYSESVCEAEPSGCGK